MKNMPFGKHKGVPIVSLETDYLEWLAQQELRNPLKGVIDAELHKRLGAGHNANREPGDEDDEPRRRVAQEPRAQSQPQGRSPEERFRRLVRQEVSTILKRMAAALDRDNDK